MDIFFRTLLIIFGFFPVSSVIPDIFKPDELSRSYGPFSENLRLDSLKEIKEMFYFGYESYLKYAFPYDELDPINCKGRGPDKDDPSNININDVLGDYSLSLIDSLDTLIILGNSSEFKKALELVLQNVSFDKESTVQVFEANIRIIGGLLSAHSLIEDPYRPFGNLAPDWYHGDLLIMAKDLAERLLKAFIDTKTGLPHPRVNLINGVPQNGVSQSCTAGVGSLVLELGMLSRLLGDPVYEDYARKAVRALWAGRNNATGLFGNVMDIQSGEWISKTAGLGAGQDSFFEYLLKSYILFQEKEDLDMFSDTYESIKKYTRRGRKFCNQGVGLHPLYVNVDMSNGNTATHWIDSLQASFPGLQTLYGDLDEAICHHILYYAIWKRYDFLPERYNWKLSTPDVRFYPLRPEFAESTYFLYRATKNPFYLHVGREIIKNLNLYTRVECGYATVHDVLDKSLEDRQESFFLSETVKYLFLLFDFDNPINQASEKYLFTTEGHIFPITKAFKDSIWKNDYNYKKNSSESQFSSSSPLSLTCQNPGYYSKFSLPIKSRYLRQVFSFVGLSL